MLKLKLNRVPLSKLTIPLHVHGFGKKFYAGWCALTGSWYLTTSDPATEVWLLLNLPEGVEVTRPA